MLNQSPITHCFAPKPRRSDVVAFDEGLNPVEELFVIEHVHG